MCGPPDPSAGHQVHPEPEEQSPCASILRTRAAQARPCTRAMLRGPGWGRRARRCARPARPLGAGPGRSRSGEGGARGGAAGCWLARAAEAPRAAQPARRPWEASRPPPMGEVEPGPAGPLEPPEPPEAPTSRQPGGIRVLKVRRTDARAGRRAEEGESGRAEAAPAARALARPRPRVSQSVGRSVGWLAASAPQPEKPGPGRRGSPPRPPRRAPAEASAASVPAAAHPCWPRATRPAGPRLRAAGCRRRRPRACLSRPPGHRGCGAGREQGCKYAGLAFPPPGHLRTSPQREDGAGDWPRLRGARGCAAAAGAGTLSILGVLLPNSGPGAGCTLGWKENPDSPSPHYPPSPTWRLRGDSRGAAAAGGGTGPERGIPACGSPGERVFGVGGACGGSVMQQTAG